MSKARAKMPSEAPGSAGSAPPHESHERPSSRAERYLRSDFLHSMAHALRSPLSVVHAGVSELVRQPGSSDPRIATMMARNVKRILRLAEQLEWVSELESGDLRPNVADYDLVLIAKESASTLDMRQLAPTFEAPPDGLVAPVDRGLMLRALGIVLDNARRFASTTVRVTLSAQAQGAEILIDDDGPGIEADRLPALYERFTSARARGADTDLALGLSIARDYVALHGGTLEHLQAPGGGARCRIFLPTS